MVHDTKQGILLICDISGYTEFIRRNARTASHARQITVRLLDALVAASDAPLAVAELEGDAVFFSALGSKLELPELAARIRSQIPRLFRAFARERELLSGMTKCRCQACSNIESLRLKQVLHAGPVAAGRVGGIEKLFGLAVIVVHRMLKNSVSRDEYLMVSRPALAAFQDFFGLEPELHRVRLEGLGEHEMLVFPAEEILEAEGEHGESDVRSGRPSMLRSLRWGLGLRVRTLIDAVT